MKETTGHFDELKAVFGKSKARAGDSVAGEPQEDYTEGAAGLTESAYPQNSASGALALPETNPMSYAGVE